MNYGIDPSDGRKLSSPFKFYITEVTELRYQSYLVFGMSLVQICSRRKDVLIEIFHGVPQFFHSNSELEH
jgi:hypothetical protein